MSGFAIFMIVLGILLMVVGFTNKQDALITAVTGKEVSL